MNNLIIFNNEQFGEVRTLQVEGKPYFVGKDIAEALGYSIPSKAINSHCKGVSKMEVPSRGGKQEMLLIPEGDVYRLIMKSQLPNAERFEAWVMDEVLPSIRKNGMFAVDELLDNPDLLIATAKKLKEEKVARLIAEATIEEYEPMIEEYKQFIECPNGCVFMDEYSKNMGLGRNKLYEILRELKILQTDIVEVDGTKYKGRRQNNPYQQFMKYFEVKFATKNDRKFTVTLINNDGQSYIFKRLKKAGYLESEVA